MRNRESARILANLGVPTAPGTDTAWTFEPAPPEEGRALLKRAGWDGVAPVLVVCPINPYWWPVRAEPARTIFDRLAERTDATHYRSLYYHSYDDADRSRFDVYLDALAGAVRRFASEAGDLFVVCVPALLCATNQLHYGSRTRSSSGRTREPTASLSHRG